MVYVDKIVDGSSYNNLTKVIMCVLLKGGGLTNKELSKKLLSFGTYGVNVFQGRKT